MKVQITQPHIDKALAFHESGQSAYKYWTRNCAFALALNEATGHKWSVNYENAYVAGTGISFPITPEMLAFMKQLEGYKGAKLRVKPVPMEFEIPI